MLVQHNNIPSNQQIEQYKNAVELLKQRIITIEMAITELEKLEEPNESQ